MRAFDALGADARRTFRFFPIVALALITTFVLINVAHANNPVRKGKNEEPYPERCDVLVDGCDVPIPYRRLALQFFGADLFHCSKPGNCDKTETLVDKILMWCALLFVETYHGRAVALLVALLAAVNFGATPYYRGTLRISTCCSSYAFWTFTGAALAVLADVAARSSALRLLPRLARAAILVLVLSVAPVVVAVTASVEGTLLHHAFPMLIGFLVVGLLQLREPEAALSRAVTKRAGAAWRARKRPHAGVAAPVASPLDRPVVAAPTPA